VFTPETSLGGVESLVEVPSLMNPNKSSHESATTDIPETLVRLSVGTEDVDDLCEDLWSVLP
jgi:cystathionine gamma-lyase